MTHLGLSPSIGEPWGLLALMLYGGGIIASLGGSTICLGSSISPLESLGNPEPAECLLPLGNDLPELLPAWVILLLTGGRATASWEPALLVAWEVVLLRGEAPFAWETLLFA